jgi:hypothetical protein
VLDKNADGILDRYEAALAFRFSFFYILQTHLICVYKNGCIVIAFFNVDQKRENFTFKFGIFFVYYLKKNKQK